MGDDDSDLRYGYASKIECAPRIPLNNYSLAGLPRGLMKAEMRTAYCTGASVFNEL